MHMWESVSNAQKYIDKNWSWMYSNRKAVVKMRKLPNGISNYEDIVTENRIYVDKTMYIEKMGILYTN